MAKISYGRFGRGLPTQVGPPEPDDDEKLEEILALAREPLDTENVPEHVHWPFILPDGTSPFTFGYFESESFDFNPDQPRDDQGRWTEVGGDGSGGEEQSTIGEHEGKDTPLRTSDIKEAAKALAEGRPVILSQPDQVATLIEELGREAAEAQRLGLAAPRIDLGKVSVEGTNLFTQESLGIPRIDMPQLKGVPEPGSKADALPRDSRGEVDIAPLFYQSLKDSGVGINENEDALVSHLRASQRELDGVKVAGIMDYVEGGGKIEGSIPVSKEGYIIDGHHRWAAEAGLDYKTGIDAGLTMPVNRVDESITTVLQQAKDFAKEWGIPQASVFRAFHLFRRRLVFDFNPDQPRDDHGRWTSEGGGGGGTAEKEKEQTRADKISEFKDLKTRWSNLDRDLQDYKGNPTAPEATKIIDEQLQCQRDMHQLNLDLGGQGGVGLPGGPRDIVIVGAGPAGLQAAMYGGSEGLDTLLVDQNPYPGGQMALSSRIENTLGFPVSGEVGTEVANEGLQVAQRLGAETKLGVGVTGISYNSDTGMKTLTLSDGSTVDARSVVMAGGVQYRTIDFPGSDAKGIVYGDTNGMIDAAKGGNAVVIGGANSAGQAALATARDDGVNGVTVLARGNEDHLREQMSDYMVGQLQNDPKIDIRYNSEIASASKDAAGNLQSITLKDGSELPAKSIGLFIGAAPSTAWTGDQIAKDERGFIKTCGPGRDALETSIPGVYAAGDVRSGNEIHRVATAGGEGGHASGVAWQYVTNKFGKPSITAAARVVWKSGASKGLPQPTVLPTPGGPIPFYPTAPQSKQNKPVERKPPKYDQPPAPKREIPPGVREQAGTPGIGIPLSLPDRQPKHPHSKDSANSFLDKILNLDKLQPMTGLDYDATRVQAAFNPFGLPQ